MLLFDHFDGSTSKFIYNAYGTFTDDTSFENPARIGSGAGTASHSPWSSPSSLGISYDRQRSTSAKFSIR